ncbi:MAG: DUF5684 domain-containing protein, partial [Bacteroidia bacterium]|nr:DUF5684 domain-containing protein [Bacteroidia bacterium]
MAVIFLILYLGALVLTLASFWKIFTKAGKPGWAAIIPFYNVIVLLEIVRKPIWWFVLFLIPLVSLFIGIITTHQLSKSFGKEVGFTIGLIFLPFIFLPILAFGDAQYIYNEDIAQ